MMPSRERVYRTEALVLRRSDWGEADRLLTLFTPERGKLRALAKGVRKLHSRKSGHLELFSRSALLIAKGRDLDIVTQAETVDAYRPVRDDLQRAATACYLMELVDRFTADGSENRALYDLAVAALGWIGAAAMPAATTRYVELHLLEHAGFKPELFHCVGCGRTIQAEDQFFSPSLGGAVCPQCGPTAAEAGPISMPALKLMRYFQTHTYDAAAEAITALARPGVEIEVERALQRYITYHLERRLKSVDFLRRVRAEAA